MLILPTGYRLCHSSVITLILHGGRGYGQVLLFCTYFQDNLKWLSYQREREPRLIFLQISHNMLRGKGDMEMVMCLNYNSLDIAENIQEKVDYTKITFLKDPDTHRQYCFSGVVKFKSWTFYIRFNKKVFSLYPFHGCNISYFLHY